MRFTPLIAGGIAAGWCTVAAFAAGAAAPVKAPAKAPPAIPAPKGPADSSVSPAAAEFFEKEVRPILVEKCYACHGEKLQQAGLRLDSRAALLRGTDAGHPGVVPGDPDKSPLIQVVRYSGAVRMPPQGKLPEKAVSVLTEWVKMGAPWPGSGAVVAQPTALERAKTHWSFLPVRKPAMPVVKNKAWAKSPIDQLVLAKLEAKGLTPSRNTDRRSLIRRAYVDLIGIPPTAAEVGAFIQDKSPTAFSAVVDRLLADPRYGERWARYWLDVARYADTKGYVFTEERRYPFSYTYRDWVIRSLNEDLPYDQFITQQLAADQLPLGEDKRPLAAMGFLTLGRRFLNSTPDIIDDRIDVTMRGLQGMTVGCARCHDHKFDPIPTKDYYSLYGVFASSVEPAELPLISTAERTPAAMEYEKQLAALQADVDRYIAAKHVEVTDNLRKKTADYLVAAHEAGMPGSNAGTVARARDLNGMILQRWWDYLAGARSSQRSIWDPWVAFSALPDAEFAAKAPGLAARFAANADPANRLNPIIAQAFAGKAPASLKEVAQRYAQVLLSPHSPKPAAGVTPADEEPLRLVLFGQNAPVIVPPAQAQQLFNRAEADEARRLKAKVDKLRATSPAAPARAMVLTDSPRPFNPHVFRRGNPNNQGDEVPRQYLAVLSGPERKPFQQGSGRLELAAAIANKNNPLTARVMVNRVWMQHFGAPLVRTPSDFGFRSDPPLNPELLDFLAARFMEDGWSLKKLHRLIMLSATYQQSSDENAANARIDPENSLLWRMNRRRLDFESMRDSLLNASGALDPAMGGPGVDITVYPSPARRTVYGFIDRQNLPGLFRTFDFASPDAHSPQRYNTSIPQQALFLMNSPFMLDQARQLVARREVADTPQVGGKIQQLYRIAYARDADPDELALALRFLKSVSPTGAGQRSAAVWQYGYGEVDDATGHLKSFQALSHFNGATSTWQGSPTLPDPRIGYTSLSGSGGHPGNDRQHAVVRRWTAPADGVFAVTGTIAHSNPQGDGVRARIISSRGGTLGTMTAQNGKAATTLARVELKKGDTLDFVVDCRTESSYDSFTWSPVVRAIEGPATGEWSAATGFSGPQDAGKSLSPLERFAQVLLMSNEFMFVD